MIFSSDLISSGSLQLLQRSSRPQRSKQSMKPQFHEQPAQRRPRVIYLKDPRVLWLDISLEIERRDDQQHRRGDDRIHVVRAKFILKFLTEQVRARCQ